MSFRRTSAYLTAAAALAFTATATMQSAQAAPLFTGGLVNVNLSDIDVTALNNSLDGNDVRVLDNVLNNNQVSVGVVAQVAAQICGTDVGGVLGTLRSTGTAVCDTGFGDAVFTTTR